MTAQSKILIIEDDHILMGLLKSKLALSGFNVITANNGEDGLMMAISDHPDLILLDIIMPKMDGVTVVKKLREDSWGKKAKIVILSNLSSAGEGYEEIKEHIIEYLVKTDWDLEDLVNKVKTVLNANGSN